MKFKIGFSGYEEEQQTAEQLAEMPGEMQPVKSVVQVRFPSQGRSYSYYNDSFDLHVGDIVFVELPEVGATFQAGQSFGVVESTKTASDVFYPVSGKVLAVNDALVDAPELVNQDPYGKGWFIKIQCANNAELDALLDANAYASLI